MAGELSLDRLRRVAQLALIAVLFVITRFRTFTTLRAKYSGLWLLTSGLLLHVFARWW